MTRALQQTNERTGKIQEMNHQLGTRIELLRMTQIISVRQEQLSRLFSSEFFSCGARRVSNKGDAALFTGVMLCSKFSSNTSLNQQDHKMIILHIDPMITVTQNQVNLYANQDLEVL
jgi:hypothetical protein